MANLVVGMIFIIIIIKALIILYFNSKIMDYKTKVDFSLDSLCDQIKISNKLTEKLVEEFFVSFDHKEDLVKQLIESRYDLTEESSAIFIKYANEEIKKVLKEIFNQNKFPVELKENKEFIKMCFKLKEIDKRILLSQREYNENVSRYNNFITQFPYNFLAILFGMNKFLQIEIHSNIAMIDNDFYGFIENVQ